LDKLNCSHLPKRNLLLLNAASAAASNLEKLTFQADLMVELIQMRLVCAAQPNSACFGVA